MNHRILWWNPAIICKLNDFGKDSDCQGMKIFSGQSLLIQDFLRNLPLFVRFNQHWQFFIFREIKSWKPLKNCQKVRTDKLQVWFSVFNPKFWWFLIFLLKTAQNYRDLICFFIVKCYFLEIMYVLMTATWTKKSKAFDERI